MKWTVKVRQHIVLDVARFVHASEFDWKHFTLWGDKMDEDLKRNIRESLVYALHSTFPSNREMSKTFKRLVISEFFHSLNRKMILFNCEVEGEISQAYIQLENLEAKIP